jgi:4-hydroxybenzoate polyprenyltransferase
MTSSHPVYPDGSPAIRITKRVGWLSGALIIVTFVVVLVGWFCKRAELLYLAAACWGVGAPLWFWFEYFRLYRRQGRPGGTAFEAFKYGQQISAAIWAGVTITIAALATSDHFKACP